ncbi:MAG: hypothetical protein JSR98_20855 [Proteobacteria bacterium]|nr:hypothetical protein [Pseudomonadota bacterium]
MRRMRGLMLLGLAAAALLGGCGTVGRTVGKTVETVTAERPHSGWEIAEDGDGLRLSLGEPGRKVQVALTCRVRSGLVDFTLAGREGDPAVMELRSGELIKRYAGAGHADPGQPGVMLVEFPVDADDPVMRRVADTGQLRIVFGDRRIHLPNAFAPAHDFLRACRAQ